MPPSQSLPSEQAEFARHLFKQGYPLWNPDPVLLPVDRQGVGLKIGDVGTVDERGRFEVFFNILEPPPEIFIPQTLLRTVTNDTRCIEEDILPRGVVSSPKTSWDVEQLESSIITDISRKMTQYSATLSKDGAHVILPQGAQLFELRSEDRRLFEKIAKEQGPVWLELFKDKLGWPRSNSLYLLTGFYKTCSWSIAAFDMENAANNNPVYVHCTLLEIEERVIQERSTWHPAGRFQHKIGPAPDRQGRDNQTVFMRGITITPNVSIREEQRAFGTLFDTFVNHIPFMNTPAGSSEMRVQTPRSNVIIQHIPQISQASHPSEIINQYLLSKEPTASVAVTHDSQWISMLEMHEEPLWEFEDLERRLDSFVQERYSIALYNGTVYLTEKVEKSPTVDRSQALSSSVDTQGYNLDLQGQQHSMGQPFSTSHDTSSSSDDKYLAQPSGTLHDHGSPLCSEDDRYPSHPETSKRESGVDALISHMHDTDGTPKRPMNAFMIFARRRRPQVVAENQSMRTGEVSKILSREWNGMSMSEKQFYLDQAKLLKDNFDQKYPDYVYKRRPINSRKRRKVDSSPGPSTKRASGSDFDDYTGNADYRRSYADTDDSDNSYRSGSWSRQPSPVGY